MRKKVSSAPQPHLSGESQKLLSDENKPLIAAVNRLRPKSESKIFGFMRPEGMPCTKREFSESVKPG